MAEFCSARSNTISPLQWSSFAPSLTAKMVEEKTFRTDLYYRINVINLEIPPLRETREIIPDLIHLFLSKLNKRRGSTLTLSQDCEDFLVQYAYPGNIRELQNILEQLAVECDKVAEINHLSPRVRRRANNVVQTSSIPVAAINVVSLKEAVREYETGVIQQAINQYGSKRKAAQALGVDIATIVRKTRN